MLEFFENLEREKELEVERLRLEAEAEAELHRQPYRCSHCGEVSPNFYLHGTNHGIVFNGWCAKRFHINNRNSATIDELAERFPELNPAQLQKQWDAYADDREWLASHGFEIMDAWSVDRVDVVYPEVFDVSQVVKLE